MTETHNIPLNKLILWDGNVRRTGTDDGIEELAASIEAHGLLQALIVRKAKGGKFAVVAGQRRLKALKLLAAQKRLSASAPVRCELVPAEADAGELSLAENVVRVAMHPADQFEAFRDLVDRGLDIAAVAQRFGIGETVVAKRLKLARLSPVVLDAYRNGEIDLDEAQAFVITDDHAAQERVLADLPEWNRSASLIRRLLTADEIPATDKRVRFVGIDTYEQAGGAVRRDLFDDAHSGTILDPALLDRLVDDRLNAAAESVRQEGWAWVETAGMLDRAVLADYRRVYPERVPLSDKQQAELEALSEEYDTLTDSAEADDGDEAVLARLDIIQNRLDELDAAQERWSAETLSSAGAIVSIGWDGTTAIERGLIRRDAVQEIDIVDGEKPVRHPAEIPATLVTELTARKTAALRKVAADNVPVMLAAIVHALALSCFYSGAQSQSCLQLSFRESYPERHLPDQEPMEAVQAFAAAEARWTELLPEDPSALWTWCLAQSQDTLLALLAHIGARAIDAVRHKADRPEAGRFVHADTLARTLGFDMAAHFTPDRDSYFGRITGTQIIAALCEAKGVSPAPAWTRMKKSELAAFAARELAGTGWLPAVLRRQDEIEPLADAA
jgi:ParB family chromosome partitioning protein